MVAAPGPRGAGAPRKFNVAPAPLVQIGPAVIKINILTKNFLGTKHHRVLILFLEDPVPWTPSSGSQNLAPGAPEIKQGPGCHQKWVELRILNQYQNLNL